MTDVEGDGHYFDRFIRHSKVLGFRSFKPTFVQGSNSSSSSNASSEYFPYSKEVVFLDDGDCDERTNNSSSALVFGGDVWDKGGADLYVIRQLLSLHRRYPNRVHFLMGNRDINKLRIADELGNCITENKRLPMHKGVYWLRGTGLRGDPEKYADADGASETAAERLKWMLRGTMGSPDAFELRRQELYKEQNAIVNGESAFPEQDHILDSGELKEQISISDDEVVKSYTQSCVGQNSLMSEYLSNAKLMIRFGPVLFMHGALPSIEGRSFPLPWLEKKSPDDKIQHQTLTEWVDDLNKFASDQITSWKHHCNNTIHQYHDGDDNFWATNGGYNNTAPGGKMFGNLLQYGMNTLPDRSKNETVVYNSWMNDGMPRIDLNSMVEKVFDQEGLQLILSGHQPVGDAPWPIQLQNGWILPCDTSFSGDVCWTAAAAEHCNSSAERVGLGRGSRPNFGRGDFAFSETLITFCPETCELDSVKMHGYLSDGSSYETNNLLDTGNDDANLIGRPVRKITTKIEVKDALFWVKSKIGKDYLLSSGKGFSVFNLCSDLKDITVNE